MPKSMSGIGASKLMGDSEMIDGCVVATHALHLMVVRSYVSSLHNFHETSVCLPRRTAVSPMSRLYASARSASACSSVKIRKESSKWIRESSRRRKNAHTSSRYSLGITAL